MSGGRARPGRRRPIAARAAVAAALVALSLFGAPGPASAAGTVTPLLDCVQDNEDGTYTAVLGYSNTTGRTQNIPRGTYNQLTPYWIDQVQPTTFFKGTNHGVFKVTLSWIDLWLFNPSWRLNGDVVDYSDVTSNACPPPTQMPSAGNGTGAAIGLLTAGAVGVALIRRYVRRAQAGAPTLEDTRA